MPLRIGCCVPAAAVFTEIGHERARTARAFPRVEPGARDNLSAAPAIPAKQWHRPPLEYDANQNQRECDV
jgi:hypothetical protein